MMFGAMFGAAAVRAQRMAGDAAPHYTGGVLRTPLVVWGPSRICSTCFNMLFQLILKLQAHMPVGDQVANVEQAYLWVEQRLTQG